MINKVLKIVCDAYKSKKASMHRVEGSFLECAKLSNGGSHPDTMVDTVKAVVLILPVHACLIIYYMANLQVSEFSTFIFNVSQVLTAFSSDKRLI